MSLFLSSMLGSEWSRLVLLSSCVQGLQTWTENVPANNCMNPNTHVSSQAPNASLCISGPSEEPKGTLKLGWCKGSLGDLSVKAWVQDEQEA